MYNKQRKNWMDLLGKYERAFLFHLDIEIDDGGRTNPLVDLLRSDPKRFVEAACLANNSDTPNIDGVSRAVVVAQMIVYDRIRGPEQDDKPKALRRHWYAYFKQYAQLFAFAIGKTRKNADGTDEMIDLQWSGRLSKIYGAFVDSGKVTYRDLWVEDSSRMMNVFGWYDKLANNINIIVCVEKDSLFSDFVDAARNIGAMAIISGKGKNSKAAAELMLRKLGWSEDDTSSNLHRHQTIVIHLSDHDFDGESVIGPTFGEQLRRYLPHVVEARIGVKPDHVETVTQDAWLASYQVKVSNSGYRGWADEKALFWAECTECGHEQYVVGVRPYGEEEQDYYDTFVNCNECDGKLVIHKSDYDAPHGFEVESLRSSAYYEKMVDAVLQHISLSEIIEELRIECRPESYSVISTLRDEFLDKLDQYTKIQAAISLLDDAKYSLEQRFSEALNDPVLATIENTSDQWLYLEPDPEEDDFKRHVRSSRGSAWRPFMRGPRDELIVDQVKQDDELMDTLRSISLDNWDNIVQSVTDALSE